MGPIGSSETSVNNYNTRPRNVPEEQGPQIHLGGSKYLAAVNQNLHIFVPKWGEVRNASFKFKVKDFDHLGYCSATRRSHISVARQPIFEGVNIQNRYKVPRNHWIRVCIDAGSFLRSTKYSATLLRTPNTKFKNCPSSQALQGQDTLCSSSKTPCFLICGYKEV